jgi:hypothetical protein
MEINSIVLKHLRKEYNVEFNSIEILTLDEMRSEGLLNGGKKLDSGVYYYDNTIFMTKLKNRSIINSVKNNYDKIKRKTIKHNFFVDITKFKCIEEFYDSIISNLEKTRADIEIANSKSDLDYRCNVVMNKKTEEFNTLNMTVFSDQLPYMQKQLEDNPDFEENINLFYKILPKILFFQIDNYISYHYMENEEEKKVLFNFNLSNEIKFTFKYGIKNDKKEILGLDVFYAYKADTIYQ